MSPALTGPSVRVVTVASMSTVGADALFRDRREAGRRLAERLERLKPEEPVVLGLPRGGVPVAYEVAAALEAPLDVVLVRKLAPRFSPSTGSARSARSGVLS